MTVNEVVVDEVTVEGRPEVIAPWDPDSLYTGQAFAGPFGWKWQSVLNKRANGESLPVATWVGARLFFKGSDIIAWLDSLRDVPAEPTDATTSA